MRDYNIYFEEKEGKGLIIKFDNNDEIILQYNPYVAKITECIFSTGETERIYHVGVRDVNGAELKQCAVKELTNIPYFKLWGIPDANWTKKIKSAITTKLQYESREADVIKEVYLRQGFSILNDKPLFVIGNRIIGGYENDFYRIENSYDIKKLGFYEKMDDKTLVGYVSEAMSFFPGVTETLFYASCISLLRPLLPVDKKHVSFVTALIGPSGHLKTSMAKRFTVSHFCEEEACFMISENSNLVVERIRNCRGGNLICDDVHPYYDNYHKGKQLVRLDTIERLVNSEPDVAQVFITAENSVDLGSFSAMDRSLEIHVPKLSEKELITKKQNISKAVSPEALLAFRLRLIQRVINNWDEVHVIVRNFSCASVKSEIDVLGDTRVGSYIEIILLVECICRYLMFDEKESLSHKQELLEALKRSYLLQQKRLYSKQEEKNEKDYVLDLYQFLKEQNDRLDNGEDTMVYVTPCAYVESKKAIRIFRKTKCFLITIENLRRIFAYLYKCPLSDRVFKSALLEAGVVEVEIDSSGRQASFTKKVAELAQRHVYINRDMLELYATSKEKC